MPPQPIHWFEGWRFRPHVYAVKGARDLRTFKRVYQADSTQKIPVRLFAQGFEYRVWGLIPTTRHLLGVDAGYEAENTLFLLGTDVQGRDMWSRLMYATAGKIPASRAVTRRLTWPNSTRMAGRCVRSAGLRSR